MLQQLNIDQHHIHDTIVDAITTKSDQNCYFVDGPAGTGKTFLYNTVVHNLQALGIKVKCMAYSGIASILLINGATAHSTFQIPIPLLPNSTCNIKRQSARASSLRETTIFIWDEASMIPANALKAVDVLLRDITQVHRPFGVNSCFLVVILDRFSQLFPEQVQNRLFANASSIHTCGVTFINSNW